MNGCPGTFRRVTRRPLAAIEELWADFKCLLEVFVKMSAPNAGYDVVVRFECWFLNDGFQT